MKRTIPRENQTGGTCAWSRSFLNPRRPRVCGILCVLSGFVNLLLGVLTAKGTYCSTDPDTEVFPCLLSLNTFYSAGKLRERLYNSALRCASALPWQSLIYATFNNCYKRLTHMITCETLDPKEIDLFLRKYLRRCRTRGDFSAFFFKGALK